MLASALGNFKVVPGVFGAHVWAKRHHDDGPTGGQRGTCDGSRDSILSSELLLSIVTVTYNDKPALELTLNSCRRQKGNREDCEFIVIDGASTDGTGEVAREYSDIISRYISEPDRGIYDAMNKGLFMASGRYIAYLNAGDVWSDDTALQEVRTTLIEHSPIWLIGGAVSLDGGGRKRDFKNIPHSWLRHALGLQAQCHQSTFIERNLMTTIGGYSEDYEFIGDFDLILRIGLIAAPTYLHRVIVTYAGGGISAVNSSRISMLQRKVRSDRMKLGTFAESLNFWFMRYHQFRMSLIPFIGSTKRLIETLLIRLGIRRYQK